MRLTLIPLFFFYSLFSTAETIDLRPTLYSQFVIDEGFALIENEVDSPIWRSKVSRILSQPELNEDSLNYGAAFKVRLKKLIREEKLLDALAYYNWRNAPDSNEKIRTVLKYYYFNLILTLRHWSDSFEDDTGTIRKLLRKVDERAGLDSGQSLGIGIINLVDEAVDCFERPINEANRFNAQLGIHQRARISDRSGVLRSCLFQSFPTFTSLSKSSERSLAELNIHHFVPSHPGFRYVSTDSIGGNLIQPVQVDDASLSKSIENAKDLLWFNLKTVSEDQANKLLTLAAKQLELQPKLALFVHSRGQTKSLSENIRSTISKVNRSRWIHLGEPISHLGDAFIVDGNSRDKIPRAFLFTDSKSVLSISGPGATGLLGQLYQPIFRSVKWEWNSSSENLPVWMNSESCKTPTHQKTDKSTEASKLLCPLDVFKRFETLRQNRMARIPNVIEFDKIPVRIAGNQRIRLNLGKANAENGFLSFALFDPTSIHFSSEKLPNARLFEALALRSKLGSKVSFLAPGKIAGNKEISLPLRQKGIRVVEFDKVHSSSETIRSDFESHSSLFIRNQSQPGWSIEIKGGLPKRKPKTKKQPKG